MATLRKHEQLSTLIKALEYVTDWSCAIDGGANVGDWTLEMAHYFRLVHSFEPNGILCERLKERVTTQAPDGMVVIHHAALWSAASDTVTLNDHPHGPTKHRIKFCTAGGDVPAETIDGLGLLAVGLIKLDLEGAEMLALSAAQQTIARCKPVMIVEAKASAAERIGQDAEAPGRLLVGMGAKELFRAGPDRVYAWT